MNKELQKRMETIQQELIKIRKLENHITVGDIHEAKTYFGFSDRMITEIFVPRNTELHKTHY